LRDLFLPLAVLNSQLPLRWINIETIFSPSWSFPSTRSCVKWRKDLLEQLSSPKNALSSLSLEGKLKIQSAVTDDASGRNGLVQRSGGEEAGIRDSKLLW